MTARTFRKTLATRIQSVLCALLMVGLLGDLTLTGEGFPWPSLLVVSLLTVASFVYVGSAFGDRYVLEADRISYVNGVLALVGMGTRRALAFDEIASISEHRGKTLFIRDGAGRRFVIDAVESYVELRDVLLYAHADRKKSGEVSTAHGRLPPFEPTRSARGAE